MIVPFPESARQNVGRVFPTPPYKAEPGSFNPDGAYPAEIRRPDDYDGYIWRGYLPDIRSGFGGRKFSSDI